MYNIVITDLVGNEVGMLAYGIEGRYAQELVDYMNARHGSDNATVRFKLVKTHEGSAVYV